MLVDARLIAVTDPVSSPALVLRQCLAAEAGGVTAVQLRRKAGPANAVVQLAEQLVSRLRVPVYVNDRADIALAAGAAGVHIGADDLPTRTIRQVAPHPFRVGVSVGSRAEAAAAVHAEADYWSIGPFDQTKSKEDAGARLGIGGFEALARLAPQRMTVVAIGGIHVDNVDQAVCAGAHGVAVTRAIFGASDIAAAARRLREALDAASSGRSRM